MVPTTDQNLLASLRPRTTRPFGAAFANFVETTQLLLAMHPLRCDGPLLATHRLLDINLKIQTLPTNV